MSEEALAARAIVLLEPHLAGRTSADQEGIATIFEWKAARASLLVRLEEARKT